MQFWDGIAKAGGERYLKSYCFGTNVSAPRPGQSFTDYSGPRGLETFEPCSMTQFAAYGHWFQQQNVPWVEPVDVELVDWSQSEFQVTLADGERFKVSNVVLATGLAGFAYVPPVLASLPLTVATHTADIASFARFRGLDVAVIGAGQSALEAAALLHEAGARPQLLIREDTVLWQTRVSLKRSLWRRLRSPISGLGTGPKAWVLTKFPGAMHMTPTKWRTDFVKKHLPAEGAWWLRDRVEHKIPIHFGVTVVGAHEASGRVTLELRHAKNGSQCPLIVDHVIAGSGYDINVERIGFIDPKLRCAIERLAYAPKLNASFASSVPGLYFIGPASAMSFGPLFRFVVGAEYTARAVSAHLAARASSAE
jgi:FAD-dependent urate hydroxylase